MIYPRLISSMKWKFDFVFSKKERKKEKVLKDVDEQCPRKSLRKNR